MQKNPQIIFLNENAVDRIIPPPPPSNIRVKTPNQKQGEGEPKKDTGRVRNIILPSFPRPRPLRGLMVVEQI